MSDTPIQTVLQQRDARPVSGEHLEVLGKRAAYDWCQGKFASLNEAVVDTVRGEQLSPEQVRRVVEFTNGDAYLREFRKEGSSHRVVHFDSGPADPAQVLQDLNDGGGGSVYDRGGLDYTLPAEFAAKHAASSMEARLARLRERRGESPEEFEKAIKTAAATKEEPAAAGLPKLTPMPELPKAAGVYDHYEGHLWDLLGGGKSEPLPYAEPMRPLMDVRAKLAGSRAEVASAVDQLEVEYFDAGNQLYDAVKQAALEGTTLGDVITAWSVVNPDPVYVKVAFNLMTPRLRRDGLFSSLDELGASITKTAGATDAVNPAHPVVVSYVGFCETLNKLAGLRSLLSDLEEGVGQTDELLKAAATGGLVGGIARGARAAGAAIDRTAPAVARVLVGSEGAESLAPTLATGMKATGLLGAGLVGNAALQQVTDQPLVRSSLETAKSVVPGTAEYQMRRYRNMTGQ